MGKFAKILMLGTLAMVVGINMLTMIGSNEGADAATPTAVAQESPIDASPAISPSPTGPSLLVENLVAACKASLALMNSRDAESFTGRKIDDDTAHVAWVRPDDGKRWQARCETIDDTHIRWAAFDAFGDGTQGRWRDEDRIQVTIQDGSISVSLDQSGAGTRAKDYPLSKLI